jgi:hypothetical protein
VSEEDEDMISQAFSFEVENEELPCNEAYDA